MQDQRQATQAALSCWLAMLHTDDQAVRQQLYRVGVRHVAQSKWPDALRFMLSAARLRD